MYILILLLSIVFIYKKKYKENLFESDESKKKDEREKKYKEYENEINNTIIPQSKSKAEEYKNEYNGSLKSYYGETYFNTYSDILNGLNNNINSYNNTQTNLQELIKNSSKLQNDQYKTIEDIKKLYPDYINSSLHSQMNQNDYDLLI